MDGFEILNALKVLKVFRVQNTYGWIALLKHLNQLLDKKRFEEIEQRQSACLVKAYHRTRLKRVFKMQIAIIRDHLQRVRPVSNHRS